VVLVSQLDLQRTQGTQTPRGSRKQPREWQKCKIALVPLHILEGKWHLKRAIKLISCIKLDKISRGIYATHGTCTLQIKNLIQQERPRPQQQNDERPVSHHSMKAHLHSWSIAKTLCCNALTRFSQQPFYRTQFPLSHKPATPSSDNPASWVSIRAESDKQMCINIHRLSSKKKRNVLHLRALNADLSWLRV